MLGTPGLNYAAPLELKKSAGGGMEWDDSELLPSCAHKTKPLTLTFDLVYLRFAMVPQRVSWSLPYHRWGEGIRFMCAQCYALSRP